MKSTRASEMRRTQTVVGQKWVRERELSAGGTLRVNTPKAAKYRSLVESNSQKPVLSPEASRIPSLTRPSHTSSMTENGR